MRPDPFLSSSTSVAGERGTVHLPSVRPCQMTPYTVPLISTFMRPVKSVNVPGSMNSTLSGIEIWMIFDIPSKNGKLDLSMVDPSFSEKSISLSQPSFSLMIDESLSLSE